MLKAKMVKKARPIIFNTEMIRAILNGTKTQTRRLVRHMPEIKNGETGVFEKMDDGTFQMRIDQYNGTIYDYPIKPMFSVGDFLYVSETQKIHRTQDCQGSDVVVVNYIADGTTRNFYVSEKEWKRLGKYNLEGNKYFSPYWTTKETARLFLKITDIRVERLQDITEEDAVEEGCFAGCREIKTGPWGVEDDPEVWTAVEAFQDVWAETIKRTEIDQYGWDANPWVFVYTFKVIKV